MRDFDRNIVNDYKKIFRRSILRNYSSMIKMTLQIYIRPSWKKVSIPKKK